MIFEHHAYMLYRQASGISQRQGNSDEQKIKRIIQDAVIEVFDR